MHAESLSYMGKGSEKAFRRGLIKGARDALFRNRDITSRVLLRLRAPMRFEIVRKLATAVKLTRPWENSGCQFHYQFCYFFKPSALR